jgi:hypothetical protein
MPHLLSLPREIRDDIYKWLLKGEETQGHENGGSHRARLRRVLKPADTIKSGARPDVPIPTVSKSEAVVNPGVGYYDYEETIRYPAATPLPPSEALARAHPRLHDEVKDAVARTKIHYKLKLGWRSGLQRWVPTWLSVPAFTSRVDVLEVIDCEHKGKPSSLWSLDDGYWKCDTDSVYAGLALLKRFLERGADLLSDTTDTGRCEDQRITVGLLVFQLRCIEDQEAKYIQSSFESFADDIGQLLLGMMWPVRRGDQLGQEDEILTFVSERVTRLELRAAGWVRSWDMKETMVERERIKREEPELRTRRVAVLHHQLESF